MKKLVFVSLAAICLFAFQSSTQNEIEKGKKVPSVSLKDMDGNSINTAEVSNDGKPIVISFWATWCKPCRLELSTIAEEYDDWQEETGVKLIAISIDDGVTWFFTEELVKSALNIRFAWFPLINKVSAELYKPIITSPLVNDISEVNTMVSLPLAIKLGLKRIVSPAVAEAIEALNEPVPESFVLVTVTVPPKER